MCTRILQLPTPTNFKRHHTCPNAHSNTLQRPAKDSNTSYQEATPGSTCGKLQTWAGRVPDTPAVRTDCCGTPVESAKQHRRCQSQRSAGHSRSRSGCRRDGSACGGSRLSVESKPAQKPQGLLGTDWPTSCKIDVIYKPQGAKSPLRGFNT